MANEDLVRLLKEKGVVSWNRWREGYPVLELDLSEADLSHADLSGVDLSHADLSGTDLTEAMLSGADLMYSELTDTNFSGAELTEADLSWAVLSGANLSGANLTEAMLSGANFTDSKLTDADLSEAYLSDANLSGAVLSGANLSGADLSGANLSEADLSEADLAEADLFEAILSDTKLSGAILSWADLSHADLSRADFSEADLSEADLSGADLSDANLSGAKLISADLTRTTLVSTNLQKANLSEAIIYGISVWDVNLKEAIQKDLVITPEGEAEITVDNLEVAQFIYLLLKNEKIRDVINTIGEKAVLILGRFTPERKAILDALREALRQHDYLPILFDFERPTSRDFTETVKTLAGLSRFVIADITNPKSSPLELQATVPDYMIPFVPILQGGERPFAMFKDLQGKYDWVLDTLVYDSAENLINGLDKAIIAPALAKHDELLERKTRELRIRHIGDYL